VTATLLPRRIWLVPKLYYFLPVVASHDWFRMLCSRKEQPLIIVKGFRRPVSTCKVVDTYGSLTKEGRSCCTGATVSGFRGLVEPEVRSDVILDEVLLQLRR
jgi:hypothetical protein